MKRIIDMIFGKGERELSDREIREINRMNLEIERAELERMLKF